MVCAYLLWSGHPECTDAESAVRFFRERRTSDGHAIHNPSQVRYVRYFASFVGASGPERALRLKGVRIRVTAISISSAPARLLATAGTTAVRQRETLTRGLLRATQRLALLPSSAGAPSPG